NALRQDGDEYPILKLNDASWEVMRKERTIRLLKPVRRAADDTRGKSKADTQSWEGVDRDLFEELRVWRRELADAKQVQPYIIFSDATLRDLARARPSTAEGLRDVYGIGDAKMRDYGAALLSKVAGYCKARGVAMDQAARPAAPREQPTRVA